MAVRRGFLFVRSPARVVAYAQPTDAAQDSAALLATLDRVSVPTAGSCEAAAGTWLALVRWRGRAEARGRP